MAPLGISARGSSDQRVACRELARDGRRGLPPKRIRSEFTPPHEPRRRADEWRAAKRGVSVRQRTAQDPRANKEMDTRPLTADGLTNDVTASHQQMRAMRVLSASGWYPPSHSTADSPPGARNRVNAGSGAGRHRPHDHTPAPSGGDTGSAVHRCGGPWSQVDAKK